MADAEAAVVVEVVVVEEVVVRTYTNPSGDCNRLINFELTNL